jgi:hypothetical protein
MIASTVLGITLVPYLFASIARVFKDGQVRRNALREADPTPGTIRP